MTRRGFLLLGSGLVAAGFSARYGPLALGDNFEGFVGDRLGLDEATAATLTAAARRRLGAAEYSARAGLFAFAFRSPVSGVVPDAVRRDAVRNFIPALLADPPERLAFALGRPAVANCGGLLRAS